MSKQASAAISPLDDTTSRRLELATRAARIAVWEWDFATDFLYCSPVFFEMLGLDETSFTGALEDFVARVAPEHHARVESAIQAHLEQSAPYNLRFDMFHQSGRRVTVEAQGEAEFASSGQPLRMTGTVRDVSDETRLAHRLLEAERVAKIGHWELDVASQRIVWSPETYRIHGLDPEQSQPNLELGLSVYHPNDRDAVQRAYEGLFRGEPMSIDARILLGGGETRYVRIIGSTDFQADGQPQRLFGVLHDRTDFVEKERQLEHSQRLQAFGQLSGGVAHDFNNLLGIILGNAEILQELAESRSQHDEVAIVREIIAAVEGGRDLTQSLLSLSRQASLQPERLELSGFLDRVMRMLRRTFPASIEISLVGERGVPPVHADVANLEACIVNLAINARDALDGSGKIEIGYRSVSIEDVERNHGMPKTSGGGFVEISVADNGCGIPADLQAKVLEPFFTTKTAGKGSGLGLPRVKGFAEQSGGGLIIDSKPGNGTKVCLLLPADTDGATEGAVFSDAQMGHVLQRHTILLVEDLDDIRKVMRRQLESMGHAVVTAEDGDIALELFANTPSISLVISDVSMPGTIQGSDLTEKIRRIRSDVPVILMSGYNSKTLELEDQKRTSDAFLMKPVTRDQLRSAIFETHERKSRTRP